MHPGFLSRVPRGPQRVRRGEHLDQTECVWVADPRNSLIHVVGTGSGLWGSETVRLDDRPMLSPTRVVSLENHREGPPYLLHAGEGVAGRGEAGHAGACLGRRAQAFSPRDSCDRGPGPAQAPSARGAQSPINVARCGGTSPVRADTLLVPRDVGVQNHYVVDATPWEYVILYERLISYSGARTMLFWIGLFFFRMRSERTSTIILRESIPAYSSARWFLLGNWGLR